MTDIKEQVIMYPSMLKKALERSLKARRDVAKLEKQIEDLEDEEIVPQEIMSSSSSNSYLDKSPELIAIEQDIAHLELRLSEAEAEADIAFRSTAGKTTEAHIKSVVICNPDVSKLSHLILEAKERKIREKYRVPEVAEIPEVPVTEIVPNLRLEALRARLWDAEEEVERADLEVDVVRSTLEAYKILSQLVGVNI